jgi:RNA polymerase sigma factor (sigma-70 family)
VRTRLRRTDHADDLVQQTLLRAFACRHQLHCASKFRGWLGSIAINEVRQFLRGTRPTVSLTESVNLEVADHAPSPFARYEQSEREGCLRAGMASLTMRDQIAIQLVDFKGLSYSEAAGVMTVSTAAFKSTHYRALQRLGRVVRSTGKTDIETLPRAA